MGKLLLNLTPSEPLALVKKLSCFDNLIELYVLLVGSLHLGVHDLIHCILLNAVRIEFYVGAKCSATSEVSNRGGKYGQATPH
jgi:hypothetical protein